MVAEICAGYLSGSMALLADGFHMATHAGALAIAAFAYRFAKRHSRDEKFSFGTGKVGDLAGFASALILGIIAIGIAIESTVRIVTPTAVAFNEAIYIAVIGLVVNLVSALMLSGLSFGHHHDHAHPHAHDNNLRSAYIHVLADALTSILAILALLAGKYYGLLWLDPAIGIVGAVVIARWAYTLMQDTTRILLDTTDAGVAASIRSILGSVPGTTLTDLHVWRIGPQARAAIVSLTAPLQISEQQIRNSLASIDDLTHLTVEMHR
jgi:cation diffusion facilitator family transporter